MTSKEQVLSMYPNAKIWTINEHTEWTTLYYVQYWDGLSKFIHLAKRKKSEELAWEEAWSTIQQNMLKKFEEEPINNW